MVAAVHPPAPPGLFDPADPRPVHFIGIAGAGMVGLAELAARRGVRVTGSDADPAGAAGLEALGVTLHAGADAAHLGAARAVVYSSAIAPAHVERAAAEARGLPVVRRAEALGALLIGRRVVGVSGTHGKTTTTVMTTDALAAAGLAPTGVAGGRVGAWGSNVHLGGGAVTVVESDEYDRSFLAIRPEVALVLNVEADHLDVYGDEGAIRDAFQRFVAPARAVVLCADDPGAATLPVPDATDVLRYALEGAGGRDARLVAHDLRAVGGGTAFAVRLDGAAAGEVQLAVPGRHNVRNALAALGAGLAMGATVEGMAPGLARFAGVERRFQRLGTAAGVIVVDDYAHHPTEVAATLEAARGAHPDARVVVAFQPHLFSRTRDFAEAFGAALARADVLLLADLYPAREQPIAGVSSALVAEAARAHGRAPAWIGPRSALAEALEDTVRPGDLVLTVGAGDITRVGPELLARLGTRGDG
jgi:UDP-N-acetylmuramate--alanine ligase